MWLTLAISRLGRTMMVWGASGIRTSAVSIRRSLSAW
jgi:hypothetical protein